jgi:hypothetical protein
MLGGERTDTYEVRDVAETMALAAKTNDTWNQPYTRIPVNKNDG